MSFTQKLQSSFVESSLIAGVAAVGTIVGADSMISNLLGSTGVLGAIPPQFQRAMIVFGLVFVADMVYNTVIA
jgi:hypothetical protein